MYKLYIAEAKTSTKGTDCVREVEYGRTLWLVSILNADQMIVWMVGKHFKCRQNDSMSVCFFL